jgi:hypothetical protein
MAWTHRLTVLFGHGFHHVPILLALCCRRFRIVRQIKALEEEVGPTYNSMHPAEEELEMLNALRAHVESFAQSVLYFLTDPLGELTAPSATNDHLTQVYTSTN